MEYVLVHRGGRGQSFVYELVYDGEINANGAHLNGLIDVKALTGVYDENNEGLSGENEGSTRGQRAPIEGPTRGGGEARKARRGNGLGDSEAEGVREALLGDNDTVSSYTHPVGA